MKAKTQLDGCGVSVCILPLVALGSILFATACGTSSTPQGAQGQTFTGNSNVTVLLTSTANDQLTEFGLTFQNVTLTNKSGKTVQLFSGTQAADFITLNGGALPLVTAKIAQGVYTSATVTLGYTSFTCLAVAPANGPGPGNLATSTYAYGYVPSGFVTVNLPLPITISGQSMALQLDLQVAQSATYASCIPQEGVSPGYSITPTFNLIAAPLSKQPTNPANGKIPGLIGEISAIDAAGSSLTLIEPFGNTYSVTVNNRTVYQGIGDLSALAVGAFVDMDGVIEPDGSLLATRVAAYDTSATNVMTGPLLLAYSGGTDFLNLGRQQQGQNYSVQSASLGVYSFSNATVFQTSGQISNLSSLPFVASFSGSNMVPGQNISVFSGALTAFFGGQFNAATTVALMPQVVNGTVIATTPAGSFTDYTVSLAPDDPFPTLAAVQSGSPSQLNNPSAVEVYIDSNTQQLNSMPLAAGTTLRFYGLVFNDNGTLRMDCAQVNDGVTANSQSNASIHSAAAQTRIVRQLGAGQVQQTIITNSPR